MNPSQDNEQFRLQQERISKDIQLLQEKQKENNSNELQQQLEQLQQQLHVVQIMQALSHYKIYNPTNSFDFNYKDFHKAVIDVIAKLNNILIKEKHKLQQQNQNAKGSKQEQQQLSEEQLQQSIESEMSNLFVKVVYAYKAEILPITAEYFKDCYWLGQEVDYKKLQFAMQQDPEENKEAREIVGRIHKRDILELCGEVIGFALEHKLYKLAQYAYKAAINVCKQYYYDVGVGIADYLIFVEHKVSQVTQQEPQQILNELKKYGIDPDNITISQLEQEINNYFASLNKEIDNPKSENNDKAKKYAILVLSACFNRAIDLSSPIFLQEYDNNYAYVLNNLIESYKSNLRTVYKWLLNAAYENNFEDCVIEIEKYKNEIMLQICSKYKIYNENDATAMINYFKSYPSIKVEQQNADAYLRKSVYMINKGIVAPDYMQKFSEYFEKSAKLPMFSQSMIQISEKFAKSGLPYFSYDVFAHIAERTYFNYFNDDLVEDLIVKRFFSLICYAMHFDTEDSKQLLGLYEKEQSAYCTIFEKFLYTTNIPYTPFAKAYITFKNYRQFGAASEKDDKTLKFFEQKLKKAVDITCNFEHTLDNSRMAMNLEVKGYHEFHKFYELLPQVNPDCYSEAEESIKSRFKSFEYKNYNSEKKIISAFTNRIPRIYIGYILFFLNKDPQRLKRFLTNNPGFATKMLPKVYKALEKEYKDKLNEGFKKEELIDVSALLKKAISGERQEFGNPFASDGPADSNRGLGDMFASATNSFNSMLSSARTWVPSFRQQNGASPAQLSQRGLASKVVGNKTNYGTNSNSNSNRND